jgi:phosphatidylglycerophosphate synthase
MVNKNEKLKKATEIARNKIGFIRHFIVYITIMIVLAIINNLTYSGYQWWLWPAFWWGIGVLINFFVVYIFKGGLKRLEEDLLKKEMERIEDE